MMVRRDSLRCSDQINSKNIGNKMAKTDPIKLLFHGRTVNRIASDALKAVMQSAPFDSAFHRLAYSMAPGQEDKTGLEEIQVCSTIYEAVPPDSTEPVAHIMFRAYWKLHYGFTKEGDPFMDMPYFKIDNGSLRIAYFMPCFRQYPDNLASYWENNVLRKMNQVLKVWVSDPERDLKIHVVHIGNAPERKSTIMFGPEITGYERRVEPSAH